MAAKHALKLFSWCLAELRKLALFEFPEVVTKFLNACPSHMDRRHFSKPGARSKIWCFLTLRILVSPSFDPKTSEITKRYTSSLPHFPTGQLELPGALLGQITADLPICPLSKAKQFPVGILKSEKECIFTNKYKNYSCNNSYTRWK